MICVLSKNKKTIIIFHLKIIIFTAVKNHSILHRRVISMEYDLASFSRSKLLDFIPIILCPLNTIRKKNRCELAKKKESKAK